MTDSDVQNIISGNLDKEINFSFGKETNLRGSCGVTFKNEHFMFGGYETKRQVYKRSKIEIIIKVKKN